MRSFTNDCRSSSHKADRNGRAEAPASRDRRRVGRRRACGESCENPMKQPAQGKDIEREEFADRSSLIAYRAGSMLIVESKLARGSSFGENASVRYDEPP